MTSTVEASLPARAPAGSEQGRRRVTLLGGTVLARLTRHPNVVVLAVYALVSFGADWPIWPGDPNRLPTFVGGDTVQAVWFLEWTPHALLHGQNVFETTLLNFPRGVDLAQNTGMQLLGLLTAPLTLAVSPVASLNLLRWLAFALSAYSAYWVIRRFVRFVPAAFLGGLLYGFSPYMITQGSVHLDLMFVPLPPLILYGLFEITVLQRRGALLAGALTGLACAAQFFIAAEVLATTGIVAAIGLFYLFFLGIRHVRNKARHAALGLLVLFCVLVPLIAYPIWIMFHGSAHYIGPAQGYNNVYNADLLGPFLPTSMQLFAPSRLATIGSQLVGGRGNLDENGSYLSIPLILLAMACVVRFWRRLWPLYLTLMALTVFVLSLGPLLVVNGKVRLLPIDLPWRKIDHLSIIENILPVRLSLYIVLFVAVLLALGLDAYVAERRRRTTAGGGRFRPGEAVALGLAALSFVALLPSWPYRSFSVAPAVHYSESKAGLRIIPTGSAVLAYPFPTAFADDAMLWQALDGMRFSLLGGYVLVPTRSGTATLFPPLLSPGIVEVMLIQSETPAPVLVLPRVIATVTEIAASKVTVYSKTTPPVAGPGEFVGRVASVDTRAGTFIMERAISTLVEVRVSARTAYVEPAARRRSFAGITPGKRVIVSGTDLPGSVTKRTVLDLRQYLLRNHVGSVLVGLGWWDSAIVADWMRLALGRPTRAGGGGEIWTGVQKRLATLATSPGTRAAPAAPQT